MAEPEDQGPSGVIPVEEVGTPEDAVARKRRLRRDLDLIIQKRRSVRAAELARIASQVSRLGVDVHMRPIPDGLLYRIGKRRVPVVTHNRGHSQLKTVYVDDFVEAVEELKLWETE